MPYQNKDKTTNRQSGNQENKLKKLFDSEFIRFFLPKNTLLNI